MTYNDEFNPLTEEEQRRLEEDEEFRRRVRNEVRRIQSGEAAEDIERDIEEEEQERQQAHEAEERERKRRDILRFYSDEPSGGGQLPLLGGYGCYVPAEYYGYVLVALHRYAALAP